MEMKLKIIRLCESLQLEADMKRAGLVGTPGENAMAISPRFESLEDFSPVAYLEPFAILWRNENITGDIARIALILESEGFKTSIGRSIGRG